MWSELFFCDGTVQKGSTNGGIVFSNLLLKTCHLLTKTAEFCGDLGFLDFHNFKVDRGARNEPKNRRPLGRWGGFVVNPRLFRVVLCPCFPAVPTFEIAVSGTHGNMLIVAQRAFTVYEALKGQRLSLVET